MLSSKILAIFVIVAGPCSASICNTGSCNTATSIHERNHYEETLTYFRNPQCKPSNLDKGIRCSAVGTTIEVAGGLVSIKLLFNNPSDHFFYNVHFSLTVFYLGTTFYAACFGLLCSTLRWCFRISRLLSNQQNIS